MPLLALGLLLEELVPLVGLQELVPLVLLQELVGPVLHVLQCVA